MGWGCFWDFDEGRSEDVAIKIVLEIDEWAELGRVCADGLCEGNPRRVRHPIRSLYAFNCSKYTQSIRHKLSFVPSLR